VSSDVEIGDVVVTSGLGGRFPPGFPVGTLVDLRPDDSHAFLVGDLRPSAQLDRGRDVLLLREGRTRAPEGAQPPADAPPAVSPDAEEPAAPPAAAPAGTTAPERATPASPAAAEPAR